MEQNGDKKHGSKLYFTTGWSKYMTYNNIMSGFRATGLNPFNPHAIPETAFTPSELSEAPAPVHVVVEKSAL